MSTSTSTTAGGRTVQLPSAKVLVGVVYAACVALPLLIFLGDIVLTDSDPYRNEGPIDSIVSIGVVSSVAVLICLGVGALLARSPERAKAGALGFGVLSVLTIIVFWSGAPGLFGATAARLAGLNRGGRPLGGAGRVGGIIGAFVAVLNVLLSVGGVLLSMLA